MAEQIDGDLGRISSLDDTTEVRSGILSMLSQLLIDYDPRVEGDVVNFTYAATIYDDATDADDNYAGDEDGDEGPMSSPFPPHEIQITSAEIDSVSGAIMSSTSRPDTQLVGSAHLELLIRDETAHSFALPPSGARLTSEFQINDSRYVVTVGVPTADLLIRCAIRREGLQRLEVFDSAELMRSIAESRAAQPQGGENKLSISALELLRRVAKAGILSLHISSDRPSTAEELEQVGTAYRVRIAYEADIVYVPILDVDRLDGTTYQPSIVRQRVARAHEFVDAIQKREHPGYMGDRLLGSPNLVDEELSLRYLRALAAREAFSAYMGYYHVLEYDMNEVWFSALQKRVEEVGGIMNRPSGDIRTAANNAARVLGVPLANVKYSELSALSEVVRSLDLAAIAEDLRERIPGALEYFKGGTLPFARVDQLDFDSIADDGAAASDSDLVGKLTRRIYAVRNAITHSKASSQRYSPYTDDLYLMREVPLVRLAAEQRIIPSSERI